VSLADFCVLEHCRTPTRFGTQKGTLFTKIRQQNRLTRFWFPCTLKRSEGLKQQIPDEPPLDPA